MFNIMTVTKVGGALCGSLLVFLLLNWASEAIYSTAEGKGEAAKASYVIEVADAKTDTAATPKAPDFSAILASADVAKGAKIFNKCRACHRIKKGVNATGPSLYGVVGRKTGTEPGFSYSSAMAAHGGVWTPANLNIFLTKPKAFVPGTRMGFAGLKKIGDRANVIAFLQSVVK